MRSLHLLPSMNTYCIYCPSGHEREVMLSLSRMGYAPVMAYSFCWQYKNSRYSEMLRRPVFDGHIFFEAEEVSADRWKLLQKVHKDIIALQYPDGTKALRDFDLKLFGWLKLYGFCIMPTVVQRADGKTSLDKGPLLSIPGEMISVNKNRSMAQFKLGDVGSHFQKNWFPIEYPERFVREQSPVRERALNYADSLVHA